MATLHGLDLQQKSTYRHCIAPYLSRTMRRKTSFGVTWLNPLFKQS